MDVKTKKRNFFTKLVMALFGVALSIAALFVFSVNSFENAERLAQSTTQTLARQCQSFDNIQAGNRVRALFSMNENITSLKATFKRNPANVNDEFLESYVDGMSLSGIAVLNGDLELVASAYTRGLRKENWREDFPEGTFERMLNCPAQVYVQRMNIGGQYYDVCAAAREDAAGIIVAYYKQPMSTILDTENDLKQLLENVRMDLKGEFIIVRGGAFISEGSLVADSSGFAAEAGERFEAQSLHFVKYAKKHFCGTRLVDGDYSIYVYFPILSVFKDALIGTAFFALLYLSFCLTGIAFKTRSMRSRQRMLEESNRQLTESANIMKSLESVYFTIFHVDLKTDEYKSIILAPWIERIIGASGAFSAAASTLINACVTENYRETITNRLDFSYIRRRLQPKAENLNIGGYYADYEVDKGDRKMWCRITLTAVDYDEEKIPWHVLVMLQDIDAEKSKEVAYQEQIIKEADLAQAANRSKSTFLFNVSHDIRTPMNAILGYSNLAKKALTDRAKLEKYLDNIQVSGERMLALINEVLEVARIENGKTTVNEKAARVGKGIRSCLVIAAPLAKEKEIGISLKLNVKYPYVYVDHTHMSRIVLNLLNNAIKFTGRGGHIDCTVNQLESERANECITEVAIADNGIGISKDFMPHIFEMFEREQRTTASGVTGTGLGLGIVKKLVDLMHGTIEVQSESGKGSVFTVRIPHRLADEEEVNAVNVRYSVNKESVKGKRILIAEDGDMNAEILNEVVSSEGIESDRAKDGNECLRLLRSAPAGYYGLVLMDIQMPNKDGLTAAQEIRKDPALADIPIIAMTANAFPEDRERSLRAGMNAHLSKPVDLNELLFVFEKYLGAELICLEEHEQGGG